MQYKKRLIRHNYYDFDRPNSYKRNSYKKVFQLIIKERRSLHAILTISICAYIFNVYFNFKTFLYLLLLLDEYIYPQSREKLSSKSN